MMALCFAATDRVAHTSGWRWACLQLRTHPNIVGIKAVFNGDPNYFYLVQELMTGGELFENIVKQECYTEQRARNTARQLVDAIAYMHRAGIIHRDLKVRHTQQQAFMPTSAMACWCNTCSRAVVGASAGERLADGHVRECTREDCRLWPLHVGERRVGVGADDGVRHAGVRRARGDRPQGVRRAAGHVGHGHHHLHHAVWLPAVFLAQQGACALPR